MATRPPATAPGVTRVGWIGTGVMGTRMCSRVLAAGYEVTLSTRTKARAEALLDAGAKWKDSAADVAAASDVVVTMVGYPADVREVTLGPGGTLAGAAAGTVLVDMSTSEPALAEEIAHEAAVRDLFALDAPVSGGDIGARDGTLSIMVGGDEAVFDAVLPLLETMGTTIVRHGGPGTGQHTKLVNQVLIAGNMIGVCEALVYAQRAGLDLERALSSVSLGAAGSWSLSNLAPRVLRGDFAPGFPVDLFVKDLAIALDEARRMRLALPGLALAHELYLALEAQGHGHDGTQSLVLALASLSGRDWAT